MERAKTGWGGPPPPGFYCDVPEGNQLNGGAWDDDDETEETLSEKILPHEHEILPKALQLLCSGKIIIHSRDVEILPD